MKRRPRDEEREQRITMEIVVDAYTPEEQAMGWYYSLEDRLHSPFVARCIAERAISPLRVGDEVEVVGMAPRGVPTRDVRPDPLGTPTPGGSPGPAGGHRGGRADPPGDRGLAVLGRSRLRAVSNADLERGPAGPPRRSGCLQERAFNWTSRERFPSAPRPRLEVTWENGS
jgi:hypothetical protein